MDDDERAPLPGRPAGAGNARAGFRPATGLFMVPVRALEPAALRTAEGCRFGAPEAAETKPVPPGWHAHLGYLYYHAGKLDQARQEFETEKATFPESTVFMNRLLAKLPKA